jgi:hypothetical protein
MAFPNFHSSGTQFNCNENAKDKKISAKNLNHWNYLIFIKFEKEGIQIIF